MALRVRGVADVGHALLHKGVEPGLAVADAQVAAGVAPQLVFAPALGQQKAEGDHLPLLVAQAGAGVVIAKAVACQPAVDVAPGGRAVGLHLGHALAKQRHLLGKAFVKAAGGVGDALGGQRQPDAVLRHHLVGGRKKILHPADAQVGGGLVDHFPDGHRLHAGVQGAAQRFAERAHALAAQQRRQDAQHPLLFGQRAGGRHLLPGKGRRDGNPLRVGGGQGAFAAQERRAWSGLHFFHFYIASLHGLLCGGGGLGGPLRQMAGSLRTAGACAIIQPQPCGSFYRL